LLFERRNASCRQVEGVSPFENLSRRQRSRSVSAFPYAIHPETVTSQ